MSYDIYDKTEKALVRSLISIKSKMGLDLEVIVSEQNGVEPKKDYVSVSLLMLSKEGRSGKSGLAPFHSGQAKEYYTQNYKVKAQLKFVGKNSGSIASAIHNQWSSNSVMREFFLKNSLAPRDSSDLRRTPQLRGGNVWVQSFTFDMDLGFSVQTIQDIDWVDYITLNGETIPLVTQ